MSGLDYLALAAILGAALVAGIFFAFSTFVMRALGRLAPREGIAAMQSINVTVINPWFLLPFFGTGVLCLAVAWLARWETPMLAACALYVVGCVLVTVLCNVPMNERLAAADADSTAGAELWARYLSRWTLWNHVRSGASLMAAALLAWALGGRTG